MPEGYVKRAFAPHMWAKFRCVGALPAALQTLTRRVFSQWLPGNPGYALAEGVSVEVYAPGDMQSPDYQCELWVPVRKK